MANGRELIRTISADPKLLNDLKARNDSGKYDLLVSRGLLRNGEVMPSLTSMKVELARPVATPIQDRLGDIDFGNIDLSGIDLTRITGQQVDLGGGRLVRPVDPAGRVVEWVGEVAGAASAAAAAACTAD